MLAAHRNIEKGPGQNYFVAGRLKQQRKPRFWLAACAALSGLCFSASRSVRPLPGSLPSTCVQQPKSAVNQGTHSAERKADWHGQQRRPETSKNMNKVIQGAWITQLTCRRVSCATQQTLEGQSLTKGCCLVPALSALMVVPRASPAGEAPRSVSASLSEVGIWASANTDLGGCADAKADGGGDACDTPTRPCMLLPLSGPLSAPVTCNQPQRRQSTVQHSAQHVTSENAALLGLDPP